MRTDLLADHKCIHVKLKKDVYSSLKIALFKHGLSMQEVFGEFARLLVMGESRSSKIVQELIVKKTEELLEGKIVRKTRKRTKPIEEQDRDVLYSLIEGTHNDDGTSQDPTGT
jgi:hypothetical protein